MNKIKLLLLVLIAGLCFWTGYKILNQSEKNNEVVFWTLQMSDFSDYMNGVISEFEEENPNIKIKWRKIKWQN